MFSSQYQCPDCGSTSAYRSRRRGFMEKFLLPIFLLQPVRCTQCFRRIRVSMFVEPQEHEARTAKVA
jgi:hypothetical protein